MRVHRALLPALLAAALLGGALRSAAAATGDADDLVRRGEYGRAADALAAALAAEPGPPLDEGRLQFDLAVCRLRQGRLAEAEYGMRRAVLLIDGVLGPDSPEGAAAREGLATVLLAQGNTIEAQEALERSLAARRARFGPLHPQTLRSLDLLASVQWTEGRNAEALALYEQVMSGLRAIHGNVHPLTATTAQNIGAVQLEMVSDWTAEIMFRQAAFIVEALHGAGHPDAAAPLCGMGDIFTRAGLLDRALVYYDRALAAVADRHDAAADVAREHVKALEGKGRVLLAQDRPGDALPLLQEAVARFDELRALAGGDFEAATFGRSPRPLLAHALLLLECPDEAWTILEGGRGRLGTTWRAAGGDSLRLALMDLEAQLAAATDATERLRLHGLWNELDAARTRRLAGFARVDAPRSADIRAALRQDDLLVGWLDASLAMGRRACWVYTLQRDRGLQWQRLPDAPWHDSPQRLGRLRECVVGSSAWDDRWQALADSVWSERFGSITDDLDGAGRLLVVAAAPMGGVPLAALGPRGGPLLLDRCDIVAAASARGLARPTASALALRDRPPLVVAAPPYRGAPDLATSRGSGETMAAADPAPDQGRVLRSALGHNRAALAGLPPLAGARDEARAVAGAFPGGVVLTGRDANEAALRTLAARDDLARFGAIHLATHALVDCRAPDRSAFVVAGGSGHSQDEGLLTAREVRLGWRLDAELVTLSACETGLGLATSEDGMLSLADAFLAAGSRTVVSSMWRVEDRATARLMAWFYEELAAGAEVPAALRTAQRRLRGHATAGGTRPWAEPRAWAAFAVYGGAGER